VPYDHADIIRAQFNKLTAERARAHGEYEEARLGEDADGVMYAADRIVEIDARIGALDRIANVYAGQQHQQQQGNRYGLSRDEVTIARGIGSGDAKLSNDDREKLYAEQKARYQHMRATGQYRDDQGSRR